MKVCISCLPWWPPHHAILRDYCCDTPYREIPFQGGWRPNWHLVSRRHICSMSHFTTHRATIVRYLIHKKKQAQKSPAILSLQVSRDMKSIAAGPLSSGKSKWGLNVLVHVCPRLPTSVAIVRRKFPLERGPKGPQKCTIVDDCARIAESGLKLPIESAQ